MDESDSEASDNDISGLAREQRLAEIAEQEAERRKMAQLKGLMSKSGKRKASDDEDESDRATSRRRTARKDPPTAASRRTRKRQSSASDRDADGDSDYEAKTNVDPLGDLTDYQRIRVTRYNFADWAFYPAVDKYFLGCFVRVAFAIDNVTRENQYRMTQIKSFKQGKPYMITTQGGTHYMSDQYVVAAYGSKEAVYPLVACSDSKITEVCHHILHFLVVPNHTQSEFNRWKSTVDKDNIAQLTKSQITSRLNGIHHLLSKQWTPQEVTQKIENQRRLGHLLVQKQQQQPMSESLERNLALQRRNEINRKHNKENIRNALLEEKKRKKEFNEKLRAAEKAKLDDTAEKPEEIIPKIKLYHDHVPGKFSVRKTDDEILAEIDMGIDIEI